MDVRQFIDKKIFSNKIIKNTGWMIGERIIQMSIGIIIGAITARYLGPSNYGIINYGDAYISFFYAICTLGLDGIIIKELVEKPQKQGITLGTGIMMRMISSLISIIGILIIVFLINPNDKLIISVVFIQSIALLFRSFELIDFWFQSRLESKYVTMIKSISYIVISIYKVTILVMGKNVLWFAFSTTLDVCIISVLMVYSYIKFGGQKFKFCFNSSKNMLKVSYHFILSGLMISIYGQIDKIMIGKMLGADLVGLYSIGITICGMWYFIPGAIIASLRPSIVEIRNIDKKAYEKKLKQLYAIIIWLGIFYAIFINLFSKYIIVILYGKEYIGGIAPLNISVWYGIFAMLGSARDIWMICEGYQKYTKYFSLIGALSNIILNAILIPSMGIIGAAIATLSTQIITGFLVTFMFKETRISSKYMLDAFLLRGVFSNSLN